MPGAAEPVPAAPVPAARRSPRPGGSAAPAAWAWADRHPRLEEVAAGERVASGRDPAGRRVRPERLLRVVLRGGRAARPLERLELGGQGGVDRGRVAPGEGLLGAREGLGRPGGVQRALRPLGRRLVRGARPGLRVRGLGLLDLLELALERVGAARLGGELRPRVGELALHRLELGPERADLLLRALEVALDAGRPGRRPRRPGGRRIGRRGRRLRRGPGVARVVLGARAVGRDRERPLGEEEGERRGGDGHA